MNPGWTPEPVDVVPAAGEVAAIAVPAGATVADDAATEKRVKPKLRGVLHLAAAIAAVPAAALLLASSGPGARAVGAAVYGAGLVILLSTSALYHVPNWSPRTRWWLSRADLSAIYVLISASYAPICLVVLDPAEGETLLSLVWVTASLGLAVSFLWPDAPRAVMASLYLALGYIILPWVSTCFARIEWVDIGLMLAGAAMFSMGAIVYAARRPDPFPKTFGYHEIFHALVVGACGCHFVFYWRLLTT